MEQRLKLEQELRLDRDKLASLRVEVRDLEMAIRHKEMLLNGGGRGKFGRADDMVRKKLAKLRRKRKNGTFFIFCLSFFFPKEREKTSTTRERERKTDRHEIIGPEKIGRRQQSYITWDGTGRLPFYMQR